jgi:hypothetical protein
MSRQIINSRIIVTGTDNDCVSATVGSGVVLWSRPLSVSESGTNEAFGARIAAASVNPVAGKESYGEACRDFDAWMDGLPRFLCAVRP